MLANGFIHVSELSRINPEEMKIITERVMPDGTSRLCTTSIPGWIEPHAVGSTAMYEALVQARDLIGGWCAKPSNRESYPPTVFNITDGEASDADDTDILDICAKIRTVATYDGDSLLINVHLSTSRDEGVVFPSNIEQVGQSRYARLLYDGDAK